MAETSTEIDTLDLPLLRQLVEWVETEDLKGEASAWNQDSYATRGEDLGRTCGTAMCGAGYIYWLLKGVDPLNAIHVEGIAGIESIPAFAARALGITHDEAWNDAYGLFVMGKSAEQIRAAAEIVAKRHGKEL